MEEKLFIGEKKSDSFSSLAVFENLMPSRHKALISSKCISSGWYFFVGSNRKKTPVDIAQGNIFVAGYRPYHLDSKFRVDEDDRRRYRCLSVIADDDDLAKYLTPAQRKCFFDLRTSAQQDDDLFFLEGNVYKKHDNSCNFSLEMSNLEWLDEVVCDRIFADIVSAREYDVFGSSSEIYIFTAKESKGHFIAGCKYLVRALLVGVPSECSSPDKWMICIDLHCGLPTLIKYDDEAFQEI